MVRDMKTVKGFKNKMFFLMASPTKIGQMKEAQEVAAAKANELLNVQGNVKEPVA